MAGVSVVVIVRRSGGQMHDDLHDPDGHQRDPGQDEHCRNAAPQRPALFSAAGIDVSAEHRRDATAGLSLSTVRPPVSQRMTGRGCLFVSSPWSAGQRQLIPWSV